MKFAIRDDDTSCFTKPEDLEMAYDFIKTGAVSLSVVPYAVPHHEKGVLPYGDGIPFGYYAIGDNAEIVSYLKRNARYDLLLHGYSHEYQQIEGVWYPEMIWKDEARIRAEMKAGKEYLEKLFDREFTVFVAPNNKVDAKTLRSVDALKMNFSGIIWHRDRDISFWYAVNYFRRWSYRAFTGMRIPDVLNYGGHKELGPYPLDSFDMLVREYRMAKKRNAPFTVYTHYWQLNRDPKLKELLRSIYQYVIDDGAELVPLSSCFDA